MDVSEILVTTGGLVLMAAVLLFFAIGYFVGKRTGSGAATAGTDVAQTVSPEPGDADV